MGSHAQVVINEVLISQSTCEWMLEPILGLEDILVEMRPHKHPRLRTAKWQASAQIESNQHFILNWSRESTMSIIVVKGRPKMQL